MPNETRLEVAKPGPFAISASRVRTNNAAPMTSIKVKAICAVTMTFRSRTPPNAVPPRSRSDDTSDRRPDCQAGARPLKTPAATLTANANSNRRESTPACKAFAGGVPRQERDESSHGKRSRRCPEQSTQQARSAGCRQEAAARAARAKRPTPAACQSHDREPTHAPGRDRRHSNRPDPTTLPSQRTAPRAAPTAAAAGRNGPVAPE